MHSWKQLEYIGGDTNFIYMDSTGSITRVPRYTKYRRPYYYAIVISKEGELFPVNEMITTDQTTRNIRLFLMKFRDTIRHAKKSWPICKVGIVDCSWASINALLRECVEKSLIEYLNVCFRISVNQWKQPINFILIYSCCSHFVKRIQKAAEEKLKTGIF